MLLTLLLNLLPGQSATYEFQCPDVSQWNNRGNQLCSNSPNDRYTCLWDETRSQYFEYCGRDEIDREGFKYILTPNPQPVQCSEEFYQPFTFTSVGNSRCVFSKSTCNGEGQVIASNGSSSTDRLCRCDYARGYVYLVPPSNGCTCVPSEEDCSCYYSPCKKRNQKLYQDYKCYNEEYILPEKIACEKIRNKLGSGEKENSYPTKNMLKGDLNNRPRSDFIEIFIIIFIVIVITAAVLWFTYERLIKTNIRKAKEKNNKEVDITRKKLVVLGDGSCGKTCLLTVYHNGEFPTQYRPTANTTYTEIIKHNDEEVILTLWDTAGQEDYDYIRETCYADCDVFVLCFALDSYDSFENVEYNWWKEVKNRLPNVPYVLVGNKKDLRGDFAMANEEPHRNAKRSKFVTTEKGKQMSDRIGAFSYQECSAKNNDGVNEVFETAIRCLWYARKQKSKYTCCKMF